MNIVIIGAGLAGARAAEELRAQGFSGSVTVIGRERHLPYERPSLSKAFLGEHGGIEGLFIESANFYRERDIQMVLDRPVTRLDRDRRLVWLDRESLPYDRLLIATGASPRHLTVEGASLPGVATLRTFEDAAWLRERLLGSGRVVIVGGGILGLELAAAAHGAGKRVAVVDPARTPLARFLGDASAGGRIATLLRERGTELRLGRQVRRLLGDRTVEAVELDDGSRLPAELVLVAIGVTPNVDFLRDSGLVLDDGVVTDAALRSSDPAIFAAGDVARAWNPRYRRRMRIEQFGHAQQQARLAARAMLGQDVVSAPIPGFGTSVHGARIQFAGLLRGGEEKVTLETDTGFVASYASGEKLQAVLAVNNPGRMPAARRLIEADAPV
jgi:3-phenylpropionate/trans-cinnamate dioxygenase ferredoxin reductase subunit